MIVVKNLQHCTSMMRVMYMTYWLKGHAFASFCCTVYERKLWDSKFIKIVTLNLGGKAIYTHCTHTQLSQTWCSNILACENSQSIISNLCCFSRAWAVVLMVEDVFLRQRCHLLNTGIKSFHFLHESVFSVTVSSKWTNTALTPCFVSVVSLGGLVSLNAMYKLIR